MPTTCPSKARATASAREASCLGADRYFVGARSSQSIDIRFHSGYLCGAPAARSACACPTLRQVHSTMNVTEVLSTVADWITFEDFVRVVDSHFKGPRTTQETADYRLGKGRKTFKKFRDEIIPAYHFVIATGRPGWIRFSLSDSVPDCWIRDEGQLLPRGIEITRANVKEQVWRARELNRQGRGRGFLGLSDDDSDATYAKKMREEPQIYITDQALEARLSGIVRCIERKNEPSEARDYSGCELLVEGFIHEKELSMQYWDDILPRLRDAAAHSVFERVHLIGCSSAEFYRRLK